jgi:hypothetical protein
MMEPYDGEPSEEDPEDPPEAAGVHEDEINEKIPIVVPRKPPAMPSEEIVRQHLASGHAKFEKWCTHCIAGKGRAQAHLRGGDNAEYPRI